MRTPRLALASVAALAIALGAPTEVGAQAAPSPPPAPGDVDAGVRLYTDGLEAFKQGQFERARELLVESSRLVPSPNTSLLIGHAERELGRSAQAMARYQEVVRDVEERTARGETQYAPTAEDARKWIADLRPRLVEVTVVARAGAKVEVNAAPIPVVTEGDRVRGRTYADPGTVRVRVQREGDTQERSEQLVAGSSRTFELLSEAPRAPSAGEVAPPPVESPSSDGPPIASWVAAGVGLVGFGVFAGFGISSSSAASELEDCDGPCPRELEETRDAGQRDQVIANVGLGVGIAGLVTAGALWLLWPDDEPAAALGPAPVGRRGDPGASLRLRF